jgi:hypothetical protein
VFGVARRFWLENEKPVKPCLTGKKTSKKCSLEFSWNFSSQKIIRKGV